MQNDKLMINDTQNCNSSENEPVELAGLVRPVICWLVRLLGSGCVDGWVPGGECVCVWGVLGRTGSVQNCLG